MHRGNSIALSDRAETAAWEPSAPISAYCGDNNQDMGPQAPNNNWQKQLYVGKAADLIDASDLQFGRMTHKRIGEDQMGGVMISCPNTGKEISTGIETDPSSFESLPDVLTHSRCPMCGLEHAWWKGEAWLTAIDPSSERTGTAA
jgi:hypothetical protein